MILLWSGGLAVGIGAATAHVAGQVRWTIPVLEAYDEVQVARLVDRQLDCYGDIDMEPNRTLAAIRKLSLRIEALAGNRQWILDSVHTARKTARKLAAERTALATIERDDIDFEAARALIDLNLDKLSKRLLVLFEELVTQTSEGGLEAVSDALSRVAAESEVSHPGLTQLRVAR